MPKRLNIIFYCIIVALTCNLIIGFNVHSAIEKETGQEKGYQTIRQFANVLKLIRKNYVDESKIDYQDLIYGAMQGMLTSLDRFSSFITPEEYGKMREETEGEFGGIGVVISMKDGVLTVVAPMDNTPGMKAGILAGDKIIKVNDKETADLTLDQAVNLIKGDLGTVVEITVFRPSTKETKTLTIERAIIEIATIKDTKIVEPEIGYIRITQFNEKSADSLGQELQKFKGKEIKALVLDLRNNPGGLLTSAVDVSSLFIPKRQLIVSTEGRTESRKQEYRSSSEDKYLDWPIAVLINEGSASAAEIVAGCLQDYGRALIVGEKSFGKGSVQSIIEVDDGSAVRLTTAKYYTPSRRVIHDNGIEPDFVVDISDEDAHKLALQRSRIAGSIDDQELKVEDIEDKQLSRAIEVLKGLTVMSKGREVDFAKILKSAELPTDDTLERNESEE